VQTADILEKAPDEQKRKIKALSSLTLIQATCKDEKT
jgi:hypothetical protein